LLNIEEETKDSSIKTISFTYDNNGNTLTKNDSEKPKENLTFTYNTRDQLVQLTRGPPDDYTILGQYDYNASGMRVRHKDSSRGDINYYYDDSAIIEEKDESTGHTLAHYHYADRLISMKTDNTTQYYHHDALGSTVNLTNQNGDVQITYQLDPWGKIEKKTGESKNRQVFTGQEHDEKSDLIYFGARYYDSDLGRFLTQDSYPGESNIPPSLHKYLYTYNNPVTYIDPNGNYVESAWDLASLSFGIASLSHNIKHGTKKDVALDALGVTVDALALALPVPGGASVGIKAYRAGRLASKFSKLKNIKKASDYVEKAKYAAHLGVKGLNRIDEAVNTYQAYKGGVESIQDFKEGKYLAGSQKLLGAALQTVHLGSKIKARKARNGITIENKKSGSAISPSNTESLIRIPNIPNFKVKDTRVAPSSHIESFREGASYLIPKSSLEKYVMGLRDHKLQKDRMIGMKDGQFVTTKASMDKLINEAGNNLSKIKKELGIPEKDWNEALYRIDIHNPLLLNPRLPSGLEEGANELFRYGGYTSGGNPEIVIDQIPVGGYSIIKTGIKPSLSMSLMSILRFGNK